MCKITGFVVVFLFSLASASYRFVCNGFLADGTERSDKCGVCNVENAARWSNPNVSVVVDRSVLPPGVSLADWNMVIDKSFAAWNDVSGSNLRLFEVEGYNQRRFGSDESSHEIFWITDVQEWRRLVGTGEFGTLGATLPHYECGSTFDKKRVITDADLVLNGTFYVTWGVDCGGSNECASIQTTLVHELGHFIGLDHACPFCESIMSARAGFDLQNPVYDDMQGLRALYPSSNGGGFGHPCRKNSDCMDNYGCFQDGKNRYCSAPCRSDNDCEQGSTCVAHNAAKFCAFRSGATAGGKLEGEGCNNAPCVDPLLCAGVLDDHFTCFKPCQDGQDCQRSQTCKRLDSDLSLCVKIKNKGESCSLSAFCEVGLSCVMETDSFGTCQSTCRPAFYGAPRCGSEEECVQFSDKSEVCMPLDGGMSLDLGSNDFTENRGIGGFGRNSAKNDSSSGGCRMANPAQDSSWVFIAFLFFLAMVRALKRNIH